MILKMPALLLSASCHLSRLFSQSRFVSFSTRLIKMDLVVDIADRYFFTKYNIYPGDWSEDYWLRQCFSSAILCYIGGTTIYLTVSPLVFWFIFDHRLMKHPLFLKNQIRREMWMSLTAGIFLCLLTSVVLLLELRGYSKLYSMDEIDVTVYEAIVLVIRDSVGLILFSDCLIYWIHRFLHHRYIYRHLHKQHHKWKIPTPFASIAFHPFDGFLQSVPYHIYPCIFPTNRHAYLVLFFLVIVWTISIHDGDYRVPTVLRPFINGSAHHTDHHLFYNYNYGQYFTFWDRIAGSYRSPSVYEGVSLVDAVNKKATKVIDEGECNGYVGKAHEG
ncbi:lathosterol oxidase-like [Acanthaster planci]|uniref:Lathosterol oxidase-like n=1 Tax=Acanthaster planci TaxID=133434 RepID=A0A8B7YI87_ACAPL|nr:lathosterol oxidase-like [Acanthaster planci]